MKQAVLFLDPLNPDYQHLRKLQTSIQHIYELIVLHDKNPNESRTVLVPLNFKQKDEFDLDDDILNEENDDVLSWQTKKTREEEDFLSMLHVALKLRGDIHSHKHVDGVDINEDNAIQYVPESLYMFVNLLLGGQNLLSQDIEDEETEEDNHEELRRCRVLSIAQDLVFSATGGSNATPKHIGLGSTLHQATRSKKLVTLFHKAGHTISYKDILKLDTALAEHTLNTMDESGSVLPPKLASNQFVHFSADNIDINESSLDGKNSFHATQIAAWQRGPPPSNPLATIMPSRNETLQIPDVLNTLSAINTQQVSYPSFQFPVLTEWFETQDSVEGKIAEITDMAFILIRHEQNPRPAWSSFNQMFNSQPHRTKTSVGYLPIIQAPAHDIDTLNTAIIRFHHVTKSLNQKHIVITVDEALFPKLMELKWNVPEYKEILIPCLGGLHTAMNFHRILGQHMQDCGLMDMWVNSGIIGPNAAEHVMAGKSYSRCTRIHKLTYQVLWRLILPQFYMYIEHKDTALRNTLKSAADLSEFDDLWQLLETDEVQILKKEFFAYLEQQSKT